MAPVAKALSVAFLFLMAGPVFAGPLDEMAVERWAKLKEAERYQLNVAEKFYREHQYKVAADEYEKFLKLYDRSEGAAFAQLKWSHCQIELRKQNTAIKDGYQSVLDYYPESPEAPVAALLIGRTHRDTGDLKLAKKSYAKAISAYPKHFAAVMARLDLVDIAVKEMDLPAQTSLLSELTFNVERKGPTVEPCVLASRQLAKLSFRAGNFDEGLKAVASSCKEAEIPSHLMHHEIGRLPWIIGELTGAMDEPTKKLGEKLTDAACGWFKTQALAGLKDEKTKAAATDTWFAVVELRRNARQPDKQKATLDEMLAAIGVSDALLGRVAQWCRENKKMDEARQTYAKYKDAAEGQSHVASTYIEEKQYDKAIVIYRQLAAADAKTGAKWLSAAAMAYRHSGKPDPAIAVYRELLVADAANASAYHFEIAETLYYAQRWKECITAYRGTERFPHNYQHMAAAHRQLKEYDEAIGLYTQIIAASQQTASWATYQIAATHEQAGRKEEAIKVFKQVCDRYPKSSEGSQAHTHLNEKYKISVTLGGAKD
ncbi:tetratricopeptide repeat protein [Zavarzinella formosa]|uniref:tetratricopeptide repeat protein n=1 Tax=Zavarzinella formosa TaxID=360055 RepID=UPI0002DB0FD7|nr:tetratricopeptide repeat protein [Zavarzinella formosa]